MAKKTKTTTVSTEKPRPRAMIAAVQPLEQDDHDAAASVAEMERLAATLAFDVIDVVSQKLRQPDATTYLGTGKLAELAERVTALREAGEAVDLVLVDGALNPRQHRTLERTIGVEVLDRTGVILEIFERRAKTRQARLEVEIARLRYELPRRRDDDSKQGRRGGGGRGERGHTNVELDKARIRDRIAQLEGELADVQRRSDARRDRRREVFQVALVGYTNAGKSSLMRGLTGSEVYVQDELFATLGTTVRQLHPPCSPPVVVSDTVGFIRRLPHELVASFHSTLSEAVDAELLLIVVDSSDPDWPRQFEVTRETLASIGAAGTPTQLVLNKIDLVSDSEREDLEREYPDAVLVSALDPDGPRAVRERVVAAQQETLEDAELVVPYAAGSLVAEIFDRAIVVHQSHEEYGTMFRLKASAADLDRWRATLEEAPAR